MNATNLIEDLRLLSPPDYRWVVALGLGFVALGASVWWWRRLHHSGGAPLAPTQSPGRPPWETALEALERLTPLLRPATSREYAIEATAVLRRYLEERYGLHAPRLATEEFLVAATRDPRLPSGPREGLDHLLRLSDLLKFGRYSASADELGELHAASLAFVMASRLDDEPGPQGNSAESLPPAGADRPASEALRP